MDNSKRVNKYQFFNIEKRNAERDRKEIREREEKEEKDRQRQEEEERNKKQEREEEEKRERMLKEAEQEEKRSPIFRRRDRVDAEDESQSLLAIAKKEERDYTLKCLARNKK